MTDPDPAPTGPAAYARAAFVALHLFAVTALALPSVGSGLDRRAWSTPTVQGEFAAWTERLNGWGLGWTQAELEDVLWDVAVGYERAREKVLWPFEPYYRYAGTWQSWRMFVAPHRYPGRLEIDVDRGSGWEPAYVGRSREHDWLAGYLDHDRFRAAVFRYSWQHYRGPRDDFADWVARQASAEWPDARAVRVSFLRYRTLGPEEARAGAVAEETRELVEVRNLKAMGLR